MSKDKVALGFQRHHYLATGCLNSLTMNVKVIFSDRTIYCYPPKYENPGCIRSTLKSMWNSLLCFPG